MKLSTRYGTHIWVVYEVNKEVSVYDDYIINILIDENKELKYCTKDSYEEILEKDIILYDDKDKLHKRICEIMKDIRKKEEDK